MTATGRPRSNYKEVLGPRMRAWAALFGAALCLSLGLQMTLPARAPATEAELMNLVQDVQSATAWRYGARDDRGISLDTLKIVVNPQGGYVGVYQVSVNGVFYVKVGTSTDLLNWKTRTMLAPNASQPTIARLSGGAYLVAYEQATGCRGAGATATAPSGHCLSFVHYPSITALLTRRSDRSIQVPRTVSRCAEGTPNIYSVQLNPDLSHSVISVGFHYFRACKIDRQAIGTLVDFTYWSTAVPQDPNATIQAAGALGHIGDRDAIGFDNVTYRLVAG